MNYDLIVHVDQNDPAIFGLALNNITNYLNAIGDAPARVRMVANGPAVQLLKKDGPQSGRVIAMHESGVEFAVCLNAMNQFQLIGEDMSAATDTVPAGIVEIVKLQREGFAYIKP